MRRAISYHLSRLLSRSEVLGPRISCSSLFPWMFQFRGFGCSWMRIGQRVFRRRPFSVLRSSYGWPVGFVWPLNGAEGRIHMRSTVIVENRISAIGCVQFC